MNGETDVKAKKTIEASEIFHGQNLKQILLEKPLECPCCGTTIDPIPRSGQLSPTAGEFTHLGTSFYECTFCGQVFIQIYGVNNHKGTSKKLALYPQKACEIYSNERVEKISPRFLMIYNQALACENRGDLELAASGFRSALELLVKDYAVEILHCDPKDVVKKTLCSAIGTYLDSAPLVKTADVVRILGNDYVHYEKNTRSMILNF